MSSLLLRLALEGVIKSFFRSLPASLLILFSSFFTPSSPSLQVLALADPEIRSFLFLSYMDDFLRCKSSVFFGSHSTTFSPSCLGARSQGHSSSVTKFSSSFPPHFVLFWGGAARPSLRMYLAFAAATKGRGRGGGGGGLFVKLNTQRRRRHVPREKEEK